MQPGKVKGLHTVFQTNLGHHLSTSYLNMLPCKLTDLHSLPSENPDEYPPHFNTYNSSTLLINPQIHQQVIEFSSNTSSSLSDKNPNSIEAKEQTYMSINHERKLKRLISNRESARRSRMRKRKQLEELQLQVVQLQGLYHKLTEKCINLLESNHQILQENAQLKEEVSLFRKIVNDTQIPFIDIEDVTRDTPCVRADGSNQFYE